MQTEKIPARFLALAFLLMSTVTWAQNCDPTRVTRYDGNKCTIVIDRNKPVTPAALTVPNGTEIDIRVENSRWDETTAFNTTTTQLVDQDILVALLKNFNTPMQSLVASQGVHGLAATINPIDDAQKTIEAKINSIEITINNATYELSCLETYNKWQPSPDPSKIGRCLMTQFLSASEVSTAKDTLIADLKIAEMASMPSQEIANANGAITKFAAACGANGDTTPISQCNAMIDQWQSNQTRYNSLVSDITKQVDVFANDLYILDEWTSSPGTVTYTLTEPKNRSTSTAIVETEIVAKTSTTIATVSVTWQGSPWVFSAGTVFSSLPNRVYSVTPIVNNGVVSTTTSTSGSTTINMQVTENDTLPSVLAPIAEVSYDFPAIDRAVFRGSPHYQLLPIVGAGANLVTKSADFVAGLALRKGGFVVGPVADFGRENFLSGGLYPNEPLPNPPSTLPAHTEWKAHVGISFTYVIALPQ